MKIFGLDNPRNSLSYQFISKLIYETLFNLYKRRIKIKRSNNYVKKTFFLINQTSNQ